MATSTTARALGAVANNTTRSLATPPPSLLNGLGDAVCGVLQIKSLRHRSAAFELCGRRELPRGVVQIPVARKV